MSTDSSLSRLGRAARLPPTQLIRLQRILDKGEEEYERTGGLSHEQFWRAVDERYGKNLDGRENQAE